MTLAAPTAKPPTTRAITNASELCAAPAPSAESRNSTAAMISTPRRPRRSPRRPAKNAPIAQPSSMEATSKPIPAWLDWKVCLRPSTVPLMTPLSKPNRKPPKVATQLMRTMKEVFSPGAAVAATGIDMEGPGRKETADGQRGGCS